MTTTAVVTLAAVLVIVLGVSVITRPRNTSTVDFYLAGQRVGIITNSWAICGDYLSAASFLGVAAAVYVSGLDGAWYAVGFAAGFLPVLLLVAAPLRRFGEFSLADFLGRRLNSDRVRISSVAMVQLVILCYLVPQSVGGGITWDLLVGHGVFGLEPLHHRCAAVDCGDRRHRCIRRDARHHLEPGHPISAAVFGPGLVGGGGHLRGVPLRRRRRGAEPRAAGQP